MPVAWIGDALAETMAIALTLRHSGASVQQNAILLYGDHHLKLGLSVRRDQCRLERRCEDISAGKAERDRDLVTKEELVRTVSAPSVISRLGKESARDLQENHRSDRRTGRWIGARDARRSGRRILNERDRAKFELGYSP